MEQLRSLQGIQDILTFPFRDARWKNKLATAAGLQVLGLVIPFVPWLMLFGYYFEVMNTIIVDKKEPCLPEWGDWGKLLEKGFKLWGTSMVYTFPVMVLMFSSMGILWFLSFYAFIVFDHPAMKQTGSAFPILGLAILGLILFAAALILSTILGVLYPAILGHVVVKDSFRSAFHFSEWFKIFRANLSGFFMSYVVVTLLFMILFFATSALNFTIVLSCLSPLIMMAVMPPVMVVSIALYALAYREGMEKMGDMVDF